MMTHHVVVVVSCCCCCCCCCSAAAVVVVILLLLFFFFSSFFFCIFTALAASPVYELHDSVCEKQTTRRLMYRMSFDDFMSNFTKLEMCMMTPVCDTLGRSDAWQAKHIWKVTVHDGSWQRQVNAGGCRNYLGIASFCFIIVLSQLCESLR